MYSTEFQDELGTSRSQERIEEALGNAESKRQLFNLPLCFIADSASPWEMHKAS